MNDLESLTENSSAGLNHRPEKAPENTTDETKDAQHKTPLKFFLCFHVGGLLLTSIGNSLTFKKMTTAMPNYSLFLNQITSLVYIPIFAIVVLFSDIDSDTKSFPKHHFITMGALDAFGGALTLLGGTFTSGPSQIVFQQASIPVTLLLSTLLLGVRFNFIQIIGAFTIVGGVVVTKLRYYLNSSSISMSQDIPAFNFVFLLASIPSSFSQVYKEIAFRNVEMDVNFLQLWVAVFQTLLSIVFTPVNSLWFLGNHRIPLSQIPTILNGGFKCLFMGKNTIVENCGGLDQLPCDTCSGAWETVSIYLLFNVCYNVFTLLVVKHSGAALTFLVSTLRLPLSSLAFSLPIIMGSDASKPTANDIIGLVTIILGLSCYRLGGQLDPNKEQIPASRNEAEDIVVYFGHQMCAEQPSIIQLRTSSMAKIRSKYYGKLKIISSDDNNRRAELSRSLLKDSEYGESLPMCVNSETRRTIACASVPPMKPEGSKRNVRCWSQRHHRTFHLRKESP